MSKIKESVMYSQLQPWSTAGAPPCMEPVSGPSVPPRVGTSYQVSYTTYIHIKLFLSLMYIHVLYYLIDITSTSMETNA